MKTLVIEVTRDDIQQGEIESCENCPVARAVKRAIPDQVHVEVLPHEIWIAYKKREPESHRPKKEVMEFIKQFDAGLPVEPFKFNLYD